MTYVHFWKKAPFARLLLPLICGTILQWQLQLSQLLWWWVLVTGVVILISLFILPFFERYRLQFLGGLASILIFVSIGSLLVWFKDIRHKENWFGKFYNDKSSWIVTLDEPLVEKARSFKANAKVCYLIEGDTVIPVTGNIIIYFKKDSLLQYLDYGSKIVFKKQPQEIKNPGNPGGFNYKRYCLFKNITHQVYLKPEEFDKLEEKSQNWLARFIYSTREKVLSIIRKNIRGKKELGLAEALLIGYKDDLDPNLVQLYTNTGVVHIIAISGLHLGLIFWLLRILFRPLQKTKKINPKVIGWPRPILIIAGLWLFSLLAGGQPSVLRSAVMFTCIVMGESLTRKTSIYNTLALSAFGLLCYNPYWLWDVGFQLSYAAVLSIIIFMRPIYNWFYIKNKIIDFIWKLNSVTIAAQILTVPLSIYHFHQFPNYFLLTNLIAVPLSSIILLGEIFLCVIAFVQPLAILAGKILFCLIWFMNSYVERIEALPYSLWEGLQTNIAQTIILFCGIAGFSFWFFERSKTGLKLGLLALVGFIALRSWSFIQSEQQMKIVVYNTGQQTAIDFINGRSYAFVGDSDLTEEGFARNFYLKPARMLYRISLIDSLADFHQEGRVIQFMNKKILLLDEAVSFLKMDNKPTVDLLVVSKNPKLSISQLSRAIHIGQIVFDGSVPAWKIKSWKKDCDSLFIPCYDVSEKGAFVMNLR
jgi:competence protein ComEC